MNDFAKDIAAKARWSLMCNDSQPKAAWSTGERLFVALVLDNAEAIETEGFTREQAMSRLAADVEFYANGGLGGGSVAAAEAWIGEVRSAL